MIGGIAAAVAGVALALTATQEAAKSLRAETPRYQVTSSSPEQVVSASNRPLGRDSDELRKLHK